MLSFRRILLDATATAGGGAESEAKADNPTLPGMGEPEAETPEPETQAKAETAPSLPPGSRILSAEQWQAIESAQAKLAELEKAESERVRQAKEKETQALITKGEAERAVKQVRDELNQELEKAKAERQTIEQRARNFARDSELAKALANHALVPGAVDHLTVLLQSGLEATPEGESFAVRSSTGKTASEFVAEKLARPEFKCFLAPSTKGGTAVPGQHSGRPPAEEPTPPPARNLGEHWLQKLQAQKSAGNQQTNGIAPVTLDF